MTLRTNRWWPAAMLVVSLALAGCNPARRIADRNARARGGLAAWRAIKTMSLAGRLDAGVPRDPIKLAAAYRARNGMSPGQKAIGLGVPRAEKPVQLPFLMELGRPHKSRLEVEFRGQTAVQVFDGHQGWKLRPFLGRREVEPYTPDELRAAQQQDELDGILIDYAAKGSHVQLEKSEKVEGRDADKIKVTLANGTVRHVWVDKQTSLEVKIDGTRRLDGKLRAVWTHYRDYRNVGGLMIPHRLETVVEGVDGAEQIIIDKVVLNPALASTRFEMPNSQDAPAPSAARPPGPAAIAPAPGTAAPKLKRATQTTVDYKLPAVTLIRDDGKTVAFPREIDDGKPVVLNFIFTTCGTICPVMSQVFSQLQERLGPDRSKVHLVSISIDPEQDRPARLAEYAKRFHAGPEWRHYTGTEQASVALQRAFDAYRGDKMSHTPVTFLRPRPGSRWVRLDGFATPDELAGEVRPLLVAR